MSKCLSFLLILILAKADGCDALNNQNINQRKPPKGTETSKPATVSITLDPDADPISSPIPFDYVGISMEWSRAEFFARNAPFRRLLKTLLHPCANDAATSVPSPMKLNVRVGGNSADLTWWNDGSKKMSPSCRASYDGRHCAKTNMTASTIQSLAAFSKAVPGSTLILDLTMVQNHTAKYAVEEWQGIWKQFQQQTGNNTEGVSQLTEGLEGLEIGNEADEFRYSGIRSHKYSPEMHQKEYGMYLHELQQSLPDVSLKQRIRGGGFCCGRDFWDIQGPMMKAFRPYFYSWSFHHYPLSSCHNKTVPLPHLLYDTATQGVADLIEDYSKTAAALGIPFHMGETNSVSCGGSYGVSDTMAASLWALDYLFTLMKHNITRVNFHGGGGGYTWFEISGKDGTVQVRPLYYSMFVWNWIMSFSSSSSKKPQPKVMIPISCHGKGCKMKSKKTDTDFNIDQPFRRSNLAMAQFISSNNSKAKHQPQDTIQVKTYAVRDQDGNFQVLVLNKLYPAKEIRVHLLAPYTKADIVTLKSLNGTMSANHNIQFAGWTWENSPAGERKGNFSSQTIFPTAWHTIVMKNETVETGNTKGSNLFEIIQPAASAVVILFERANRISVQSATPTRRHHNQ